ncbi:FkbM family methyltransferase [Pseudooceanicola sp.]|uniref:FkbM family methyltransferase n=1 Tax=Pseudooceanicola sp. TaxID=1914328 RepID=UPI0026067D79|nr:FkbM family methyltransferase [Pseudooceanicola sp.]MDF1856915.1 FkbM family methyltransferase [Pseudooceanicola sp.]
MPDFELNGVKLSLPEALAAPKILRKLKSGQYEGFEARAAGLRVRKGFRVLELGGGMGYVGSICANITGGENLVTVEANPDMIPVIRANFDQNGHQAATLLHGAVTGNAAEGETLEFRRGPAFWGASIAEDGTGKGDIVEVPLLRIGELLKAHRPNVVIMDIEGAEQHLFDAPWPRHVRFVMMEIHPARYPASVIRDIFDCMSASNMAYDPRASSGGVVSFRRLRDTG